MKSPKFSEAQPGSEPTRPCGLAVAGPADQLGQCFLHFFTGDPLQGQIWALTLLVLLYGLGNGMLTIVKGTAIAQYASRDHVASLNGALAQRLALSVIPAVTLR